jgi:hypothetical protein
MGSSLTDPEVNTVDVGDVVVALHHRPCTGREISVLDCPRRARRHDVTCGALEDAMFQLDPWEKAADCERALRLTIDPTHRDKLTNIRDFWISLAHKRLLLSESEFATEAEAIARLHANLTATTSIQ